MSEKGKKSDLPYTLTKKLLNLFDPPQKGEDSLIEMIEASESQKEALLRKILLGSKEELDVFRNAYAGIFRTAFSTLFLAICLGSAGLVLNSIDTSVAWLNKIAEFMEGEGSEKLFNTMFIIVFMINVFPNYAKELLKEISSLSNDHQ